MFGTATEARGRLTVTVRHNKRETALDQIRAISGLNVQTVDTSFGSHTIVTITAPAARCTNGLPDQIRVIRGVIGVQPS